MTTTKVTQQIRQALTEHLDPGQVDTVLGVLEDYNVTPVRRGGGVVDVVVHGMHAAVPGGRSTGGFGPGALQEAMAMGRRFGRWPR